LQPLINLKIKGTKMNQFKIALFLLSIFFLTKPLLSMNQEDNYDYIEDSDNSESFSEDEESENEDNDDLLRFVFTDYINLRSNFQSCWGFVQSDYNAVADNWTKDFFNNKFKIKYSINENDIERTENKYFKEIDQNDLDLIEGILENKVLFFHWFKDRIKESKYNSKYLKSIFLSKKITDSWKKHLYINGLIKYYLYNHHLLDLLTKNIKDSFTKNVEFNYQDERGHVQLCETHETNLSKIRTILRQIEQDLKNNIDLQKCFELKKHPAKICPNACLHTYFKKIKDYELHHYYNLSLGRFTLLEKVFGKETIKNLISHIELYKQEKSEILVQEDLDALIATFPKNERQIQQKKSKKTKGKGKRKRNGAKKQKETKLEKESNLSTTKSKPSDQSVFQIVLPNGKLFDCPQQHIMKEVEPTEKPIHPKKKKGLLSKIKEKAEETISSVQDVAHFIQNPQEEMQVLMRRINDLLHHQSSLKRINAEMHARLEYENQKVKEVESAKAEIEEKYIGLKQQIEEFESQKDEQEKKLHNLEKTSGDTISYVKTLEELSANTLNEANGLRGYANALSQQTHTIIGCNHEFAALLYQSQHTNALQYQYIMQLEKEKKELLEENARLKEALAQKKE
jgi:hypothetical protein